MIYNESPRRKQISEQVSWGHWFALANILIAIAISSIYIFSTPVSTSPISIIYMFTMWVGHISFIAFLGFIIFILPLCYQLTNLRILKGLSASVAAVGLALLAFDALIYNQTGSHLSFSSAELLRTETRVQVDAFGWLQWFYLCMLVVVWLMLQLVIANAIYKRLKRFQRFKFTPYMTTAFVLCFIASHGIHVWADAKLYTPILKQDNMFPLSYPATAKTLMARYGLLDLEIREQQEELQYQVGSGFLYPPKPVYCSVKNDVKMIILMNFDGTSNASLKGLKRNEFHLVTSTDVNNNSEQIKYAMPLNMVEMISVEPVLLDLLAAFNIPSTVYVNGSDSMAFDEFSDQISTLENGFHFGILDGQEFSAIADKPIDEKTQVMMIAKSADTENFHLYSNFLTNSQASTNEDIAPTVLQQFGCMADVERYSTGQALQDPIRNWVVSTKDENLIFFKYPMLTEVARDGSYKVIDITTNKELLVDIDTNMLSRSIKHLESFTQ